MSVVLRFNGILFVLLHLWLTYTGQMTERGPALLALAVLAYIAGVELKLASKMDKP